MNTLKNHTQETFMNPTEKVPVLLLGFNESWKREEVNGDEVALPEDWSVRTLGESFEISGGGTPPTHDPSYWGGEIVWVGPKCMGDDIRFVDVKKKDMKTLTPLGASKVAAKPTPAGSLIVSSRAPVGYANIAPCDLYTNQGCYSFIAGKGGDTSYLYFWIRKHRSLLQSRSSGTTFLEISRKAISTLEYAAPSLDEQTLISQVLTTQESQIQDLRKLAAIERQRLSWLSDELLSGRLRVERDQETTETVLAKSDSGQDAEERLPGVRIVANQSWKTVEMNGEDIEIPKDWDVAMLKDFCRFVNGSAFKPSDWNLEGKGLKIARIQNLSRSEAEYNYTEMDKENLVLIDRGDLLMSWSGTIDMFKWEGLTAALNQHIFRVDISEEIQLQYMEVVLKSKIPYIKSLAHGATMVHVRKEPIATTQFAKAKDSEQTLIAQALNAQQNQISDIEKLIEVEQKRLEWLSDELLSGRIRVKQASKE